MRDSSAKRNRILKAATKLFVKHGFDGTTFANVSKASGAAVGSIVHFFHDKGALAAAVYDRAACRLVDDAKAALHRHKTDVEAAIRALLSVCLKWAEKFPHDRSLISKLEAYMSPEQSRTAGLQDRLAEVLADWAKPLISKRIVRLSPSQLYAVILAPAMCATAPVPGPPPDDQEDTIDWREVLTVAALTVIRPLKNKPKPPSKVGPVTKVGQPLPASTQGDLDL
jgi:AcrR family transcriptional regulator